jgi:hypothetical protein
MANSMPDRSGVQDPCRIICLRDSAPSGSMANGGSAVAPSIPHLASRSGNLSSSLGCLSPGVRSAHPIATSSSDRSFPCHPSRAAPSGSFWRTRTGLGLWSGNRRTRWPRLGPRGVQCRQDVMLVQAPIAFVALPSGNGRTENCPHLHQMSPTRCRLSESAHGSQPDSGLRRVPRL